MRSQLDDAPLSLEIAERDRARWEEALWDAREYARRREEMLTAPSSASPPEGSFSGELLDFQKQGLAFLLSARRCLLADEMGLGKTVQALAFLATTAAYPAILVVPPHLVRNWINELHRFLSPDHRLRVHVIKGLTPYALRKRTSISFTICFCAAGRKFCRTWACAR